MLELLLSILLAFGLEFSEKDPITVNDDVMQKIQSSSDFEKLGGNDALNQILNLSDTEQEQESSVVTDQTEPIYTN